MNTLGIALMVLGFFGVIVILFRISVEADFEIWSLILYLFLIGLGFYLLKDRKKNPN